MIPTDRLVLRPFTLDDVDAYLAYRTEPDTLKWLGSLIAPTRQQVIDRFTREDELDGPTEGQWYPYAIERGGELLGDVGYEIRRGGGVAEVGYTLAPAARGHGYAAEAAGAVVDHLVASHGIQRLEASLAADNVASMRVLEAIGMTFEVLARQAFDLDGTWVDDLRYAMTAADRAAWVTRVRTPPATVELAEITPDDAHLWGRLRTHHSEERLVSPMAASWRDALFPETFEGVVAVPWMRGALADGERAGFVMLSETHGRQEGWYLWRLLVDRVHQRRGIGRATIEQVAAVLRAEGVPQLFTSCVEGPGSPRRFYERLGFVATGRHIDGETELVLPLR